MIRRSFLLLAGLSLLAVGYSPSVARQAVAASGRSAHVCGTPARGSVRCSADVVTMPSGRAQGSTTPPTGSYGPIQFHTAYNLPCAPGGPVQSVCAAPTPFGGQTIAIVDAYDDPTVENDLAVYDVQYGLPACTRANGCLTVVNEHGGSNLPSTDGGWALEISLDVEIAHAICQTCKILLVEAKSASLRDLGQAEDTAAQLGATEISNSWGALDSLSLNTGAYDTYFNHPGVAVLAASGDFAGGWAFYPATSQYVLAVGGTSLHLNSNNTYSSETAWVGGASGCASQEPANPWQTGLKNWSQTGCGTLAATVDVAADADPYTGAAIYDSTPYNGSAGWWQVGGTSLSSPLVAGVVALAGGTASYANAQQVPYVKFNSKNSHDVTIGLNGYCGLMCTAGTGYDGPTGLGTPNGTGGF